MLVSFIMAGEASMFIICWTDRKYDKDNQPITRKSLTSNRPISSRLTRDYDQTRLTNCNNYSLVSVYIIEACNSNLSANHRHSTVVYPRCQAWLVSNGVLLCYIRKTRTRVTLTFVTRRAMAPPPGLWWRHTYPCQPSAAEPDTVA